MKWNKGNSGSVLMEFVVVLPIYMLLLGFVFVVGEVSLHAINLASGDRLLAMQRENGLGLMATYERAMSPTKNAADGTLPADRVLKYRDGTVWTDARVSNYDYAQRAGYVADASFKGAWSMIAAATVRDSYTLSPWTRALVMFWVNHRSRTSNGEFDLEEGSALSDWMRRSGLGRHVMIAKDPGVRAYGYYTLMRKKNATGQYRVGTGGIVDAAPDAATWLTKVAREPWLEAEDMSGIDKTDRLGPAGVNGGDRSDYARFDTFVTWSE